MKVRATAGGVLAGSAALIIAGFLTTLIAPALGAEHHLRPEAVWVARLHEASLMLMALGVCCVIAGYLAERWMRK